MIKLLLATLFTFGNAMESNTDALKKIWEIGQTRSCSPKMRAAFSQKNFDAVRAQLTSATDRKVLAAALNPFLFSHGYSHTEFFTDTDDAYFLFKGRAALLSAGKIAAPLIITPGIQLGKDDKGYYVRAVLDGFPAKNIYPGDRILTLNGAPFHGIWPHTAKTVHVEVAHRGEFKTLTLELAAHNWAQAFQDATLSSSKIITHKNKKIGYIRHWTAVHPDSAQALSTLVAKLKSQNIDALILDLRDGYGGSWWEHLDPFFRDRTDYFTATAVDGDDKGLSFTPDPQNNPDAFTGPMAVLINNGSRSGKEALAFQFKKSKRAKVFGTSTAGSFAGGGIYFADDPASDYVFYLCGFRDMLLDGIAVEGIGVRPDVFVEFAPTGPFSDTQLEAALDSLFSI